MNLKFLPEAVFVSKGLASGLLCAHLLLLFIFAHSKFTKSTGGLPSTVSAFFHRTCRASHGETADGQGLNPRHVAWVVMVGNFVGVVCARSLHYQFYSWYFHSVPFLLWCTQFPVVLRLAVWGIIEVCWNVFPSTAASSLALLAAHVGLLVGLWLREPHHVEGKSKSR